MKFYYRSRVETNRTQTPTPASDYPARMWDRLSDFNDGHHVAWAYCAGQNGGPTCGSGAAQVGVGVEHGWTIAPPAGCGLTAEQVQEPLRPSAD
jgi:hypothetical protein